MNALNMPGFTAVASLYNGHLYRASTEAASDDGLVKPAMLSDEIDLDQDLPFLTSRLVTHGNCRKPVCIHTHEYYPGVPVCDQWIWIWGSCWP